MRYAPALRLLKHLLVLLLVALVSGLMWKMSAYEYYSNFTKPDGLGNCASCHELAVGGFQGKSTLHRAHTNLATNTCKLCHTASGDIPRLSSSGVLGSVGCIGCHGQPLGDGTSSGAGLRLHHTNSNVPADQEGFTCVSCHVSDPVPPPENSVPVYYGRIDVDQTDPCNGDDSEDFWSRNTGQPDDRGLDNDGDLLVDALDPDCGAVGEVENVGFNDPLNPERLTWDPQDSDLYDVIRSDSPAFPEESSFSACLVVGTPMTFVDDVAVVPPGRVFYYLVKNTLASDYGQTSNGTLRLYTVCP